MANQKPTENDIAPSANNGAGLTPVFVIVLIVAVLSLLQLGNSLGSKAATEDRLDTLEKTFKGYQDGVKDSGN